MRNTALLLLITLVLVPLAAIRYDVALTIDQQVVLEQLLITFGIYTALGFVVSTMTKNYSQVDKLWSIMPILYAGLMALSGGLTPRLLLMTALVTLWGVRLTYNVGRKGAFGWPPWRGEQDYRWTLLQQKPALKNKLVWALFNLTFISGYQMGLVLLITLPMLLAVTPIHAELNYLDWVAAGLVLIFILIETVADQQQWVFQQAKKRGETTTGFISTGLWAHSRHPNYVGEQGVWVAFYLFSVATTGRWLNWTIAGPLLLLVLFQGSANFIEKLNLAKYPNYARYVDRVAKFVPWSWSKK